MRVSTASTASTALIAAAAIITTANNSAHAQSTTCAEKTRAGFLTPSYKTLCLVQKSVTNQSEFVIEGGILSYDADGMPLVTNGKISPAGVKTTLTREVNVVPQALQGGSAVEQIGGFARDVGTGGGALAFGLRYKPNVTNVSGGNSSGASASATGGAGGQGGAGGAATNGGVNVTATGTEVGANGQLVANTGSGAVNTGTGTAGGAYAGVIGANGGIVTPGTGSTVATNGATQSNGGSQAISGGTNVTGSGTQGNGGSNVAGPYAGQIVATGQGVVTPGSGSTVKQAPGGTIDANTQNNAATGQSAINTGANSTPKAGDVNTTGGGGSPQGANAGGTQTGTSPTISFNLEANRPYQTGSARYSYTLAA